MAGVRGWLAFGEGPAELGPILLGVRLSLWPSSPLSCLAPERLVWLLLLTPAMWPCGSDMLESMVLVRLSVSDSLVELGGSLYALMSRMVARLL